MIIAILIPIASGLIIFIADASRKFREIFSMASVILTSAIVILLVCNHAEIPSIKVLSLTEHMSIALRMDGLSRIFALLLAVLWPIATLWSFEYMHHERRENTFFSLYTGCYGVMLGICFSANLISFYLFYELLTLVTLPLITHSRDQFSKPAGIKYIAYSIAGATAAFAGILLVYKLTGSFDFAVGGVFVRGAMKSSHLWLAFYLMFFGFGVKAAIFPLYEWLPSVGVAPTPVTALLHAVAVVKSGCYAITRITYYVFGPKILQGSKAQTAALLFAAFTIVFGSIWANRETHFKRRLAMSTVSNLSYIIFGIMLMTPAGLCGAMLHLLFHGVMKITLFFTAGACHVQAHADYVEDLKGFGRRMPVTFASFTVASLALIGVPPLCGFYSKIKLGFAAAEQGSLPAYLGMLALIVSAVYTAFYLLNIIVPAYFPEKSFDYSKLEDVKDPGWRMKLPFILLALLCICMGLFSSQISDFIMNCTGGLC